MFSVVFVAWAALSCGCFVSRVSAQCGKLTTRPCPPKWQHWGQSCYSLTESTGPWSGARDACARLGGYLAVPQSEEENQFVVEHVRSELGNAWIDCNDLETNGVWVCKENGVNVAFRYWDTLLLQPEDLVFGQDCALVTRVFGSQSRWHDSLCSLLYSALCKRPMSK